MNTPQPQRPEGELSRRPRLLLSPMALQKVMNGHQLGSG